MIGNDISGFADPRYLSVAAAAGATVVATHIRLRPRVADPDPHYDDVTATVRDFPPRAPAWAPARRDSSDEQVILDAGLDLGKTAAQSLSCCATRPCSPRSARRCCSRRPTRRFSARSSTWRSPSAAAPRSAAVALGITQGCRILRVHDVAGSVRVRDALERIVTSA